MRPLLLTVTSPTAAGTEGAQQSEDTFLPLAALNHPTLALLSAQFLVIHFLFQQEVLKQRLLMCRLPENS